jgi:hypothetical protein
MQCRQIEQRLQELLDSREAIDSDDEVREHLELCGECAVLAAAYDAVARSPAPCQADAPHAGLAARVVAEAIGSSRTQSPTTWLTWGAAAIAACLLVALGLNLDDGDRSAPAKVDAPVAVSENSPPEAVAANTSENPHRPEAILVPGHDMWYRTGQGLASISLVGLRSQRTASSDSETTSNDPLLDRAFDTLRTLWPSEGATGSPTRGETGSYDPNAHVLVC